ncbi:hypothetical protein KIN20_038397 [Parelaphostrongylus tenuis]|uniref:Reverse transcriptase domain-containing protein n=1 Tax=Parelaphostrongylus tenuis TaxID=148309 RepID=A0AAD5QPP3_PARTN|nr:hypothetical protein KIN20_038397 [Parelaphostrongylus tenuis]
MGQRLALSLALAVMSKVEAPVMDLRPLLYCRYIDDCSVICSSRKELDNCFRLLNEQSEYIKFTRDLPKDDWLQFLNVQINLTESGYITKWYRKPSNKNVLVHYLSSHPSHTKKGASKKHVSNSSQRMYRGGAESRIRETGSGNSHS